MPRLTDIWRTGIVHAPLTQVFEAANFSEFKISWLSPGPPFTFIADPFGIWRDGRLFIFVETFDYRDRLGGIDVLCFDDQMRLLGRSPALRAPWHLSYPALIEADGAIYMLPEAHRSGALTLYRATNFPTGWEAAAQIELDCVPVDATPFYHDGLWWLLYSPATRKLDKVSRLQIAYAESLIGPWHPHPLNSVRIDRSSARPGGTPIISNGCIIAPMQDCSDTYGGAIRPLHITRLTPTAFEAEAEPPIRAPDEFAPFNEGLHTLSACGDITLIDAKRIDRSLRGLSIDAARHLRRLSPFKSSHRAG